MICLCEASRKCNLCIFVEINVYLNRISSQVVDMFWKKIWEKVFTNVSLTYLSVSTAYLIDVY